MGIKVDVRVPVGCPLPQLAGFIRRCEDAGFHGVGVHDHHHTGRDVYVALAVAAAGTATLRLYPATSNSVTRHPLVLAALASSLAEIAPGRVHLTLAPGFLSVERAGEAPARRAQLAQTVTTVRELLRGSSVPVGDTETSLRFPADAVPPVFVLASGPRLLELAGEVADGVMLLAGLHPQGLEAARAHVRAGARRAGRDPAEVTEIHIVPTAIGPAEEAREWPRRWFRPGKPFLTYPSASNLRWLRAAGIDVPDDHRPEELPDSVVERICDAFGLFGPAEHCAERLLRAREEAGVDHVFLFPSHTADQSYELPVREVEAFSRVIGPRLAG
ncbi:MAG: LLM class flavin-dependent oxidoreductase [Candidatus Dormibacteraeota bacterium]|nr:LLM class flavin-dependent oxidoreductase [Candidatus Dormibacteraeota bacterium]